MTRKIIYSSFLAIAFLNGCGGGGGSSVTDSVKTGTFIDAPVEGLHYKTKSQEGFTDKYGHFKYKEGEHITFNIGNFEFGGEFLAKEIMTPYDIAKQGDTGGPSFFASVMQSLDEEPNNKSHILLSKKLAQFKIDYNKYKGLSVEDIIYEASLFMDKDYTYVDSETAKANMDAEIKEFMGNNPNNTTDKIPDFFGFKFIVISNNVNSKNEAIKNQIDMYNSFSGNTRGKALVTNIRVYCKDYGYSSDDLINSFINKGVQENLYIKNNGTYSCTEHNYLDNAPSIVKGNDTVILGTTNNN